MVSRNTLLRAGVIQILTDVVPDARLLGFSYHDLDRYPDPSQYIDLLLISIASPERLTSLVTAGLRAFLPQKMILLGEGAPDHQALRSLPKQVAGFIDQSAPAEVFVDSVRRVLGGRSCFPWDQAGNAVTPGDAPSISGLGKTHAAHEGASSTPASSTGTASATGAASTDPQSLAKPYTANEAELLGLTRRQYEVLVLLSQGHALKSVARILNISLGTTKAHTESVYQRLGAHNRNQAVYLARSKGATLNWEPVIHSGNNSYSQSESESDPDSSSVHIR
ncbi:MAG TPA: hypothetical protein DEB15_01170 [Pusillimonas sp.]|nr:hypothetical protein [Pusillimonas sp.]